MRSYVTKAAEVDKEIGTSAETSSTTFVRFFAVRFTTLVRFMGGPEGLEVKAFSAAVCSLSPSLYRAAVLFGLLLS
jgi:hypothetical protein